MRVSSENILSVTYALLREETALAAIDALRGNTGRAAIEGLCALLIEPHSAREALAVLDALEPTDDPLVLDALTRALDSPHALVRTVTVQSLQRRRAAHADDALARVLARDGSWPARRAALMALADRSEPVRWHVLLAADDPHWRVRHALLRVLLVWNEDRQQVEERLAAKADNVRVQGMLLYLRWRWTGALPESFPLPMMEPCHSAPFWDWDAAVIHRKLDRLGVQGREQLLDLMPALLAHSEERVRSLAADTLRRCAEPRHLAEVLRLLDEPRLGTVELVRKLFKPLDLDTCDEIAAVIRSLEMPSPAQLAWARQPDSEVPVAPCTAPLPSEQHPFARAAALTPATAAELVRDPERETSWHVLSRATRLARVPLWDIAPAEPWKPMAAAVAEPAPLSLPRREQANARLLGPEGLTVSQLGVSGHYGLPVNGFVRAAEEGVNLLFWEPNYQTLNEFMGRLSAADRDTFHVIAGTFEADGSRVRKDAERALRTLKIERLAVFLIFWVQSWDRRTDDVRRTLERLKEEGKVTSFGLSTHNRPLAIEAMDAGWNPVMVRHSAAHRGAEQQVFPHALKRGTSILTFNNTCYGRLLKPHGAVTPPGAADCYRYTLSQPAVTACLSAPATLEQLEENLAALRDPVLVEERRAQLLAQGDLVYKEDTMFRKLVRSL